MQTGDGLLVRLSPLSGGLSPNALIRLCESAAVHGNGTVEITARGSLQFRGFSQESARCFAEDVDALAIAVRVGVPVETGPLAGLDPAEIANPLPVAERIRRGIAAAGLSSRLGPKVSVVVDGGGSFGMEAVAGDVRLTAERHGDAVLWWRQIAGKAAASLFSQDDAVEAVLSILRLIAERGRGARATDLPDECIAPPPAGTGRHGTLAPEPADPMHGPYGAGILTLRDGRTTFAVALPFGHADAARLAEFAGNAGALGIGELRPAPNRGLLPICPSRDAAEGIRHKAATLGFVTEARDSRRHIVACPGAPACRSGLIAARAIAAQVAECLQARFGERIPADFTIHVSGCEKGCARQAAADITIVGGEKGAGLVVSGTTKSVPVAYRSVDGLPEAITSVALALMAERAAKPVDGCRRARNRSNRARLAASFEQGRA